MLYTGVVSWVILKKAFCRLTVDILVPCFLASEVF